MAERLTRYCNSLKENDDELKGLKAHLDRYRKSEKDYRDANAEELATLKREVDLYPRDVSLLSEEQKVAKNRIKKLQELQNAPFEHSKKMKASILIKHNKENRQRLEKEQMEKVKNEKALNCETSDFRILWGSGFFTVAFFTKAMRSEFLNYLSKSEDDFAELLRKFGVEERVRSDDEFQCESVYQRSESICSEQLSHEASESEDDDDSDDVRFES